MRFKAIYTWDEEHQPDAIGDDAFVYDLVSNTVCADLLDYLERDCYFCGIDPPPDSRFINFLYLMKQDGVRRAFVRLWKPGKPVPRRDTLGDLAGLLHSRYLLAERVYFHHTKINSGAMLGRAILEAMLAGKLDERSLWTHGDDSLLLYLTSLQGTLSARLAEGLRDRRLHKLLVRYTESHFSTAQESDHEESVLERTLKRLKNPNDRLSLENALASQIGAGAGDVLIYIPSRKMNLKAAGMRVLWKGDPKKLKDIDDHIIKNRLDLTLEAHKALWAVSVIVNPGLSERQLELLKEATFLELCCNSKEAAGKREAYYEKLVEEYLLSSSPKRPMDPAKMVEAKREVARRLAVAARDGRDWKARLSDAVNSVFGEQPEKQ